jgi:hypothetical protein
MQITKKFLLVGAGATALLVGGGAAAFAAVDSGPAPKITVEKAVELAQAEVSGAWVSSVDFDNDKTPHWSVELVKGNVEHEVELDAATGKVLQSKIDKDDKNDDKNDRDDDN